MRIVFCGTNAATPTADYGTSGVFVQTHGTKLLFDCGEGTQQRMMKYGASINVDAVFLTHFDSDHVLGLSGLIRTLELNDRSRELKIFAPDDVTDRVRTLIAGSHGWPDYHVSVNGFNEGVVEEYKKFEVRCFKTQHDYVSHGFVVEEDERDGQLNAEKLRNEFGVPPSHKYGELKKGNRIEAPDGTIVKPDDVIGPKRRGRKVVYTGDCQAGDNVEDASENADVLIHESTFHSNDSDKARDTSHATAKEAATVASRSNSSHLVMTHLSARYEGREDTLAKDAQTAFDGKVDVARDGFSVDVPSPE